MTGEQMIQPEMSIVSCENRPSQRWLIAFVLVAFAAITVPAFAQEKTEGPSHSHGYVEDWSSHHVVFSNPGAEPDVRERDRHDRWLRIVNDERYIMQQRRRGAPRRWGGWGHDVSSIQRDWSMLIGTATAASATGTFSGEPDNTSMLTIKAGVGVLELEALTTGATGTSCALVSGTTYLGSFTRSFTASTDASRLATLINSSGCGNLVGVTASSSGANFTITATGPGQEMVGTAASDSIQLTSTTGTGTNFDLSTTWTATALTGGTGMNPNAFPAKYNQDYAGEAPSCNDYIVFPTGVAGSASQATIIGYKNLYKTTCTSNSGPDVAFAYNTGTGTSTLSPVLSSDGKQIAYIQTVAGVASLVLLRPSLTSGSTVTSPTLAASNTAYYNSGTGCTAPCYYKITLSGSPNDTNSSPFYTYTSTGVADTLYVGDDSGNVHKFSPVFNGAPAEITTNWPATASSKTNPKLASPVYDSGGSGLVYVTDATGYLNSISAGATPGTASASSQMECGTFGFVDGPVVDSSNEFVYVFVGDGCSDGTAPVYSSYVNVFPAAAITGYGHNNAQFGNQSTNSIGTVQYHGMFDNAFYESAAGAFGNLYGCVNGALFQIPMASLSTGTQVTLANSAYDTPASAVSDAATCSGVTEYCNNGSSACTVSNTTHKTNAGTDYLFFSLEANGSATGCTNGCIYNYNVTLGNATGTPSDDLAVAGGTTSIVIDNSGSATGESQVYFGSLSSETCAGNGSVGSSPPSGSCAVQASQSALQ